VTTLLDALDRLPTFAWALVIYVAAMALIFVPFGLLLALVTVVAG